MLPCHLTLLQLDRLSTAMTTRIRTKALARATSLDVHIFKHVQGTLKGLHQSGHAVLVRIHPSSTTSDGIGTICNVACAAEKGCC